MEVGKLYFVKDEFYERFKDCGLLENKDIIDGKQHNRPCCYLFKFKEMNEKVYWMIPISSQVEKYKKQYELSIKNTGYVIILVLDMFLVKNVRSYLKICFL